MTAGPNFFIIGTLMAPKWPFERYAFDQNWGIHENWAWMLHVGAVLPLVMAPEVVCEDYLMPGEGFSRPGGFSFTRRWYEHHKALMSPKARSAFVARSLSSKAAFDRRVTTVPWLAREMARNGGMTVRNVKRLLLPWLVPARVRQTLKTFKARRA